jgi:hypothetical protein
MNHRHRKILHSLFSHPLPSNIHLHDVETVFRELGAELGHTGHGRLSVSLKGQSASLHGSGHGLSKDEVSHIRKFIESCGIEPSRDFPI